MKEVVLKKDTVEEAVAAALAILQASKEEVEVHVLSMGAPGVLGTKEPPVVVRVVLKTEARSSPHNFIRQAESNLPVVGQEFAAQGAGPPATAALCQGQLLIEHEGGEPPILVPCPGVKVLINGRQIHGPHSVSKKDIVKIETIRQKTAGSWKIRLDENKLRAYIELQPYILIKHKLRDAGPSHKLHLQVAKEELQKPPLSLTELVQALHDLDIKEGVDWDACRRATATPFTGEILLAEGRAPLPPRNGYVELFFLREPKYLTAFSPSERVDYRERFVINSVAEGTLLARRHAPTPGSSGLAVTGEIIVPKEPIDVNLHLGKGALMLEDRDVIAAASGQPLCVARGNAISITVEPVFLHMGNVDLASGNLNFQGHIRVLGDVEEGMLVNALRDVTVAGLVSAATVQAGGSIFVEGNVISSNLIAGGPAAVVVNLQEILQGLIEQLLRLRQCMEQLRGAGVTCSNALLFNFLILNRFGQIPRLANRFKQMVMQLPRELRCDSFQAFAQRLSAMFSPTLCLLADLVALNSLVAECQELQEAVPAAAAEPGHVHVENMLNSVVRTTGDVNIWGQCSDHSQVHAGGSVKLSGIFRGGEIKAGGSVKAGEIGSPVGTYTKVSVPHQGSVKIGCLHENVLIRVGHQSYWAQEQEENLHFYMDKREQILRKEYVNLWV